jgi:hypothetical protein
MTTYAIQDIATEGDATEHHLDIRLAKNDETLAGKRANYNEIFKYITEALNIFPDTVLYATETERDGDNVALALFTDEECANYTGLEIIIEEPAPFDGVQTVTLGVNEAPYATIN